MCVCMYRQSSVKTLYKLQVIKVTKCCQRKCSLGARNKKGFKTTNEKCKIGSEVLQCYTVLNWFDLLSNLQKKKFNLIEPAPQENVSTNRGRSKTKKLED